MKAQELEKEMKKFLGDAVLSSRIQTRKVGRHSHESLWLRVDRDRFHDAVENLMQYGNPQLAVVSGTDLGDSVELLYHFDVYWPKKEFVCTICAEVPKKDMRIPTITDLVPGATLTEREKQEFFGIDVVGLKDKRRAFLADDLAKAHPWIKDDKETAKLARNAHGGVKK